MTGRPTSRADVQRCQLDDVIALCMDARRRLQPVITRMAQRMLTVPEADDFYELREVRKLIWQIEQTAKSKRE